MAEKLDEKISPKIFLKSMAKIAEGADKSDKEGDEEKAYVLLMRYCSIFQLIIRSRDYKIHKNYFDSMLDRKRIEAAMTRIEELQETLTTRFEERQAKELLAKRDEERKKEAKTRIEASAAPPSIPKSADAAESSLNPLWLSPAAFVHHLRSPKPPLVFDLRSREDADAYPLKADSVICLDPSCVPQAATVRHISEALKPDIASYALFESRASWPKVVLLDDNSKPPLKGVLKRVKEAIFDWDASQQVKEEPLFVDGGFENFFFNFPTFVANAQKYREVLQARELNANRPGQVEIRYPNLEERNRRKQEEAMEAQRRRQEEEMALAKQRREEALEAERLREEALEADRRRQDEAMALERKRREEAEFRRKQPDTTPKDMTAVPVPPDRQLKPQKTESPSKQSKPMESPEGASRKSTKEKKDTKEAQSGIAKPLDGTKDSRPIDAKDTKSAGRTPTITGPDKPLKDDKISDRIAAIPGQEAPKDAKSSDRTAAIPGQEKTPKDDKISDRTAKISGEEKTEKAAKSIREEPKETSPRSNILKSSEESKPINKPILKTAQNKIPPTEAKADNNRSKGDNHSVPAVNRALKPVPSNNHNDVKTAPGVPGLLPTNHFPKQWSVRGGARIHSSEPEQQGTGAVASTLEQRVDTVTGREYLVDLTTLATRWADGASRPPQHPSSRVTKAPLKDEQWPNSSGGGNTGARLKRSGSQPNLSTSSHDDVSSIDVFSPRGGMGSEQGASGSATPSSSNARPQMPSRETKPRNLAETDLTAFDSETLRSMHAEYGTTERGLTGLRNLGNSCYMNSVLQALSNTPCLKQYIVTSSYRNDINRSNPSGYGGEIAEEFATLLRALWAGRYRIISPVKFKRTVGRKNSMFASTEQQDSQEFLLFLLDGLHEDFNAGESRKGAPPPPAILEDEKAPWSKRAMEAWKWHEKFNRSFVVSFFQGQFRSTVRCLTCDMTSTTFDVFMYLSLQIPSQTRCSLRDCISQFSKEERMTGSSQWHCPRCRQNRDAVKHLALWRLPPYLLIHLKRFSFEQSLRAKMNTLVEFPLEGLQMDQEADKPRTYDLYAVSNHYGSMESGHYTAYCLNPGLWKWFKYDDDCVTPIADNQIRSSAAYILFYATRGGGLGYNEWFE